MRVIAGQLRHILNFHCPRTTRRAGHRAKLEIALTFQALTHLMRPMFAQPVDWNGSES
jgi:hypothetical protein